MEDGASELFIFCRRLRRSTDLPSMWSSSARSR